MGGDKEKVTSEYQTTIREKDNEIEKLRSSLRTVEREIDTTKRSVEEKNSVLDSFTRERTVIVAEIQDIMKRLRNIENSHVTVRDNLIQEFTSQSDYDRAVFDIKIIIEKIDREFQVRRDTDKQQSDMMDKEKKDRTQQTKEIEDLKRKLDSLQYTCTTLENEKNALKEENNVVVIRCDDLNKDVEEQQNQATEKTKLVQKLDKAFRTMQKELEQIEPKE